MQSTDYSKTFGKKYHGYTAISLNGKIIGVGKNGYEALKEAKKRIPEIEEKKFLVQRIHDEDRILVA